MTVVEYTQKVCLISRGSDVNRLQTNLAEIVAQNLFQSWCGLVFDGEPPLLLTKGIGPQHVHPPTRYE